MKPNSSSCRSISDTLHGMAKYEVTILSRQLGAFELVFFSFSSIEFVTISTGKEISLQS